MAEQHQVGVLGQVHRHGRLALAAPVDVAAQLREQARPEQLDGMVLVGELDEWVGRGHVRSAQSGTTPTRRREPVRATRRCGRELAALTTAGSTGMVAPA
jgi:hypothetical protein